MAIEWEDFGIVIGAIVACVVGFAAMLVAAVVAVVGYGLVLSLLVMLPVVVGSLFEADDKAERIRLQRHDEWATELIVKCIHRGGRAKFGSRDEYLGCEPLP